MSHPASHRNVIHNQHCVGNEGLEFKGNLCTFITCQLRYVENHNKSSSEYMVTDGSHSGRSKSVRMSGKQFIAMVILDESG